MPWVKLDDGFPFNRKAIIAGKDGRALYVTALCWTAGQLTDGHVDDAAVPMLAAVSEVTDAQGTAAHLVETGLWERVPGGYEIKDWLRCGVAAEPDTQERRKSREYEDWRAAVIERDHGRCRHCGSPDFLHVHHILSWAMHPEMRLDVENGITLCAECHGIAHRKGEPLCLGQS
jgi:hypothetical protein